MQARHTLKKKVQAGFYFVLSVLILAPFITTVAELLITLCALAVSLTKGKKFLLWQYFYARVLMLTSGTRY